MIMTDKIETPPGEMIAGATNEGLCLPDHEKKYSDKAFDLLLF